MVAAKAVSEYSPVAYECSLFLWRTVISIFFREVRPRGAHNIPRDGPVIFVAAPHSNQFIDGMLLYQEVYRESRRHVRALVAASSMKRRFVGHLLRLMGGIPVARAFDYAKPGTGEVVISKYDPCLVIGYGTKFTSELKPNMQIVLPKTVNSSVAHVVEVISDNEVKIRSEFPGIAQVREKIEEVQEAGQHGLTFRTLPYIDQNEMFQYVYQCLTDGDTIGIFPEGGSHDRTDLLPLKAGVSMMALGAMAKHSDLNVKIVPVGLAYFHAHRFRSRAVVEFGTPLNAPLDLVEMFKEGGAKKRVAVGQFLDTIYDALKTVTMGAPDYDTLMLVQAARRLYRIPGQHLTLGQVVQLNRRMLQGYLQYKDKPRIQKLRKDVSKYNRMLRDLGLRDHQVPTAKKSEWRTLGLLMYRLVLLSIWSTLALPGVVLNGPIFITASIISRKKAKEALAASEVKIAGRDIIATWKILVALTLTPILYISYALLATYAVVQAGAPSHWRTWTPVLVLVCLPVLAYAALKFGEAGLDVLKSLRPLLVALIPGQQCSLDQVKRMRQTVSNELYDIINEFGGCEPAAGGTKRGEESGKSSSLPGSTAKDGLRTRVVSQCEPVRVGKQATEDCVDILR